MEQKPKISQFLDCDGKIKQLPQKQKTRYYLLEYLAGKFESNNIYSEHEVNDICNDWHTFGDYFLLRRELVDFGFLCRERDGSRYWKTHTEEEETDEIINN